MLHKFTITLALVALLTSMVSVTYGQEFIEPKLTIISGFKGGSNYQMAMDMQRMSRLALGTPIYDEGELAPEIVGGKVIVDEMGDTSMIAEQIPSGDTLDFLRVRESEGSYYNFLKIIKSGTDLAFLQYDVLLYESMKDLTRTYKKADGIRVIMPMGVEEIHIIVRKSKEKDAIKHYDDLKGKNVAIGSSLQGTNITAKYIKEVTKMKWHDVELPFDKALKALLSNRIDAFFYVGKAPVSNFTGLSKAYRDKITIIPLDPTKGKEELKEAYTPATIESKAYPKWIKANVATYSVRSLLVTDINGQTKEQEQNIVKLMQQVVNHKNDSGIHPNWEVIFGAGNEKAVKEIDWDFYEPTKGLF